MSTTLRCWTRAVLVALALLALQCTLAAGDACGSSLACFPWSESGPSCERNGQFSLRFMLDLAEENAWTQSNSVVNNETIYAFCPKVDYLQSFTLFNAPFLATGYQTKDSAGTISYHFTQTLGYGYLSVYGFGNSNNTLYPEKGVSTGSVVFAQNGSNLCISPSSVAIVTTLVLEVGLNKGVFNYDGSSAGGYRYIANPNYNPTLCANGTDNSSSSSSYAYSLTNSRMQPSSHSTSTSSSSAIDYCSEQIYAYVPPGVVQPLKTGFVSTCQLNKNGNTANPRDYTCLFDSDASAMCIGSPGQMNCARCYTNPTDVLNMASVQVWTSYYGTDSNSHALTSGGSNPLNFRRFAKSGFMTSVSNKLKSLWNWNVTTSGLPDWPFGD